MGDTGFFDVASARRIADAPKRSQHRSGSTDDRECSGPRPSNSSQSGPGRSSILRRIEDSQIGDAIGAIALFVILIGGLWIGAGLS